MCPCRVYTHALRPVSVLRGGRRWRRPVHPESIRLTRGSLPEWWCRLGMVHPRGACHMPRELSAWPLVVLQACPSLQHPPR